MNVQLDAAINKARSVIGSGDKAKIEGALGELRSAARAASSEGGPEVSAQLQTANTVAGALQRESQGLVKRVRDGMM